MPKRREFQGTRSESRPVADFFTRKSPYKPERDGVTTVKKPRGESQAAKRLKGKNIG